MPSPSLRCLALGFSFENGRHLFHDVTFQLGAGWTGLVGSNGAGKTTLLELLAGERAPAAGRIELGPTGAVIARCADVRTFSARLDGLARALHGRLRLDAAQLERWPTLSPGERRRWQLGAALAMEPDVLLLDEPTNHLDTDAAQWLVPELRRFRGIGVLVSHDRALLDAVTTSTLRVERGEVRLWPGSWAAASVQWDLMAQIARAAHGDARQQLKKSEQRLQRAKTALAAATSQRSTGKRMKSKRDSDARTLAADFRVEQAEKALAGRLRSEHRDLEHAKAAHASTATTREVGADFSLEHLKAPRPMLLTHGDYFWGREDRVWLHGANGSGKSTLLRALAAKRRDGDAIFYLPQELTGGDAAQLLAALKDLDDEKRGRVLQWLAVLGVPPWAVLSSQSPSSGEARKLALALGLGRPAWGLMLDEPTHHLDAPAVERLEAALQTYPGALLLATHDQRFADGCTTAQWDLSPAAAARREPVPR